MQWRRRIALRAEPTAHRKPSAFAEFGGYRPSQMRGRDLRLAELDVVKRFIQTADLHGFIIPYDNHTVRDPRLIGFDDRKYEDYRNFPPEALLGMFGLAQHHGIPTRLLDWTTNPLIAAYFAAVGIGKRYAKPDACPRDWCQYFSIYAIRRITAKISVDLDPEISFPTVPTATNANLHAQGGLFSLVQYRDPLNEVMLPAIDKVLSMHAETLSSEKYESYRYLFPLMVEFQVPITEARTVLATLAAMGVTAATAYPNLQGVADSVKEERFRQ